MAEFAEVMRKAIRICAAHGGMCISHKCPLDNGEACRLAADQDGEDYSDVERIIMAWAAEHPAPQYPTWHEWQKSTFPDAESGLNPCEFGLMRRFGCDKRECCYDCAEQPIPADIAAQLGIRPIEEAKDDG